MTTLFDDPRLVLAADVLSTVRLPLVLLGLVATVLTSDPMLVVGPLAPLVPPVVLFPVAAALHASPAALVGLATLACMAPELVGAVPGVATSRSLRAVLDALLGGPFE
jgi:hypothetical protein